jgi:hypothetical protein
MFYKVNPNLVPIERAASTSALASTSTSVPQSNQPPQTPAFAPLPESHITVNEPIVVSDSSDEEDDGYDTAPSSPTMGASELEITRNKLEFYKQLFLEASGKLKNLSNHRRPAKDKNHHDKHHHQHHRTGHHHMTTRSERRTEARARREQHELIRTHILSNAGQPRQYVSQETQVRHANTERLPQLRQSLLQGESSDENDDSGSYREYPARRDILKVSRKRMMVKLWNWQQTTMVLNNDIY